MHPVIAKTFGGLSTAYYVRNFLFGLVLPVFIYFMMKQGNHPLQAGMIAYMALNTVLYPYSRFVYESVVRFIVGANTFYGNAFLVLFFKSMTMVFCWVLAIFVAPLGLIYLYFHHSR